jgi:cation diffusion facilitator CzcD-associated flavoprotein CzcO
MSAQHYDAVIIGAGFGGLRALYELREMGLSVKVIEAASDIGGTWYWNRYPGARTDSEAWVYCYSFSKEVLEEYNWPERMPNWEHVLDYLDFVAKKFDLRKHVQFDTRVKSAAYDEAANLWRVISQAGEEFTCTWFVAASGWLSVPIQPPYPGRERFKGETYMSMRWPHEPVDFAGKRVGIIGSGSTAVQMLPIIAQTAAEVTMFQRTPNYVMPGRNYPLDDATRSGIKANYDAIWAQVRNHVFAFPMDYTGRDFDAMTPEQVHAAFDAAWEDGGFRYIFRAFDDLLVNPRSNAAAAEFFRNKIRAIVKDPETAELLCPDYPIALKRPPLGNFYYEAFNRPNVKLVDVRTNPVQEVTETGVRTGTTDYDFDVIIFALGFDAMTGSLTNMDVRGVGGQSINEKWQAGPRTNFGLMIDGFPNMFMIVGPHAPFANVPPLVEAGSQWMGRAIAHARAAGSDHIETTPESVQAWGEKIQMLLDATLLGAATEQHSWFMGANVPGKVQAPLFYFGGATAYFDELAHSAESGFPGFETQKARTVQPV